LMTFSGTVGALPIRLGLLGFGDCLTGPAAPQPCKTNALKNALNYHTKANSQSRILPFIANASWADYQIGLANRSTKEEMHPYIKLCLTAEQSVLHLMWTASRVMEGQ